jgi:Matrixin
MRRAAFSVLSLAFVLCLCNVDATDPGPLAVRARHRDSAAGSLVSTPPRVNGTTRAASFGLSDGGLADVRRRVRNEQAGTYIGDILLERDSSLARWPERDSVPLTVWVQPRSRVHDFSTAFVARVRAAFEEWDALHLPLHFAFVDDSADAEVHVVWIDRFHEPISGRTRWARDDNWSITDANITLAVHHNQGDLLEDDAMQAMALHEIGHLLGLDHTTDTTSIMAPRVRVRALSAADRATARLLYALPAGPIR